MDTTSPTRIFIALRLEDRHPITEIMAQTPPIPDACQWGLFLRNHDELTLEMVTDEERTTFITPTARTPRPGSTWASDGGWRR